jgi:hypothetical protein
LKTGPGGLLLLGDNGVGKTSWVDAIEKPLTGKCSSVETGDQTLSWARHGAHIHSDDPPRVTLIFSDGGSDYEVDLRADPAALCEGLPAISSIVTAAQGLLSAASASSAEEHSLKGLFFAEVLSQGLTWISTDRLTNCPLCESPIDFASVKRSVEQRLASHDKLIRLRTAVVQARLALVSVVNHHLQVFGQVAQEWPRAMANVPQALSRCITALSGISTRLASSSSDD